jgi:two-component system cell cycle sensor histidine kinase/response regulator CckA
VPDSIVLLVDDEDVVREVLQEGLAARGWTAIAARHAEDALALDAAYGRSVEVLVTDVVLPRMSGHALVERLRRSVPDLGVVFVSGHPPDPASLPGRASFLQKPFTVDDLDGAIRALL